MKLGPLCLTLLLAIACRSAATADDAATGKRVALLVGINAYQKPFFEKLKYAERDVQQTGQVLKTLGFEVTTLTGTSATRQAILAAAQRLVQPLSQDDIVLVMLCGHGLQLDAKQDGTTRNDAFFCPFDAVANAPETLVSLSHLIDDVLAPNVGRKLLLVDACRNDPNPGRGTRGIEGRVISLPEDTAVMFSCRKGQKALESDELQHGLFTYCVLDGLRGQAAVNQEIAWSNLLAHVERQMASPEFRRHLVGGAAQQPIQAGGVSYTVLGRTRPVGTTPQKPPAPAGEPTPVRLVKQLRGPRWSYAIVKSQIVEAYTPKDGSMVWGLEPPVGGEPLGLRVSPDASRLAIVCESALLMADSVEGTLQWSVRVNGLQAAEIQFSPESKVVILKLTDGTTQRYDAQTGKFLNE
jgi:hypothetical protein